MAKFDIYEAVTNKVIEALDKGTVPWRKPWSVRNGDNRHRNLVSKRAYRGVNQFLLEIVAASEGYSSPYWLSFKQVSDKGGKVIKGQKSTMVVFWKTFQVDEEVDGEVKKKTIPLLRYYNVFNVEQCEGIEAPVSDQPEEEFNPITLAEIVIENMPACPAIRHGGNRAFYQPSEDQVQLPKQKDFKSPEAYYAVAFHELAHATGHESRLNVKDAFGGGRGSESYAREELRAEMTAAMVCAALTIDPDVANTAAYVRSWLGKEEYINLLKGDRKLVIHAAARAQRAADYILNEAPQENGEAS